MKSFVKGMEITFILPLFPCGTSAGIIFENVSDAHMGVSFITDVDMWVLTNTPQSKRFLCATHSARPWKHSNEQGKVPAFFWAGF